MLPYPETGRGLNMLTGVEGSRGGDPMGVIVRKLWSQMVWKKVSTLRMVRELWSVSRGRIAGTLAQPSIPVKIHNRLAKTHFRTKKE